MVNDFDSNPSFRLSIKSLEPELDARAIDADAQALCSRITQLSSLGHTTFTFLTQAHPLTPRLSTVAPGADRNLSVGLWFEAPLNKFRVVLRCVGNWLDRTTQRYSFEVSIPPAYTLTLQTNQAKVLAQLLPLGEALLPPGEIYLTQAEGYVHSFGELTPAAKANLLLVRHRMGLSADETHDLNARAMGPFKTLADKYQHFRKELLVCQQEGSLDDDFWRVMQAKAATMGLPEADAQFLKAERINALRHAADQARQQAEAEAEANRQRHREQQQRLTNYRRTFEALAIDALATQAPGLEATEFHQGVMAYLSGPEFNRGRLTQARGFYQLNPQEADALEKTVLDELYLLSGLL
ncbi:hypothetical protein [Nodosilinea sp. E11]|uniref:hypothetical protein n=1 Tax=Nodosilinea sp. E11 TaxID=3037479 RepID=UPI002934E95E|nr:hypothetical protein [Nodosilinea sp. E11]WOD38435.1 hypothetical protein RRF56_19690 [Nodosilinea sp. E11]